MNIAIIGAGNIGSILATKFTKLGHQVFIANSRGPETLTALASEIGATPATVKDAIKNGDVVIIAIPFKNIPDLPEGLFQNVPDSVAVIDTSNYYPTIGGGEIHGLDTELMDSQWVQKHIGKAVNKAFNNFSAEDLNCGGGPGGNKDRFALPVAGDDDKAKVIVMQLIEELGFDPYDQGLLKDSWRQQPGTPIYAANLKLPDMIDTFNNMEKEWTPEIGIRNGIARDLAIAQYVKNLMGQTEHNL